MAVKVVRGYVGGSAAELKPSSNQNTSVDSTKIQISQATSLSSSQSLLKSSEATINALRSIRSSTPAKPISSSEEAKTVAHDLAEQIREEGEGAEAHVKLNSLQARGHFNEQ